MPTIGQKLTAAIKGKTYMSESDYPFEVVQWDRGDRLSLQEEVQQYGDYKKKDFTAQSVADRLEGQEGLNKLKSALALLSEASAFVVKTKEACVFDLIFVGYSGDQVVGVKTQVVET